MNNIINPQNNLPEGRVLDTADIKPGVSRVKVFRRDEKGKVAQCHIGIVLAKTSSFLAVYNPAPTDKGGDPGPEHSQWHPAHGMNAWCEFDGETKVPHNIPAVFKG